MPDSPPITLARHSLLQRATPWLIAFAVVFAVAASGAAFPPDVWFAELNKPTWQPPDWVFAPVWTVLYLLIALQLLLSAAWTPLFFGLHSAQLALLAISLLWLALIGCISVSLRVHATAGWLLLPTLGWVSFALVLNGVIVALNA